jgi:UrcA family protein
MQITSRFAAIIGLCATAAVGQAPSAHETSPVFVVGGEVAVRHVSFADLDLAGTSDRKALVRRLEAAVSDVCEEALGPSANYYAEVGCWKSTWRKTQPQLTRAVQKAREVASTSAGINAAAVITVQVPR